MSKKTKNIDFFNLIEKSNESLILGTLGSGKKVYYEREYNVNLKLSKEDEAGKFLINSKDVRNKY